MRALVVLSGGQDSTTCLLWAFQKYGRVNTHAVTFDYGQRHRIEIDCAVSIANLAGIRTRHEIVTMPGILKGASPLIDKAALVDSYANAASLPGGLEKTFVPMRNQLFLTVAINRAVLLGLYYNTAVDVITGVSEEDYGGYPDCRALFIRSLVNASQRALEDPGLPTIDIVTPLIHRNKKDTVLLSESLPGARVLIAYSHTCYNGQQPPCGKCHACLLRAKGYDEAGIKDPLIDRQGSSKLLIEPILHEAYD